MASRAQLAKLLEIAKTCQCAAARKNYLPFFVERPSADTLHVGWVRPEFAAVVVDKFRGDDPFRIDHRPDLGGNRFTLRCRSPTFSGCTEEMKSYTETLRAAGVINGWRNEFYGVGDFRTPLANHVMVMERAAATYFGTQQFGVHINVFVQHADGVPEFMWIARRAEDKATWPGLLDQCVAGGLSFLPDSSSSYSSENPDVCMERECWEEASISPEIASLAQCKSFISYDIEVPEGLFSDHNFCYDCAVPPDFTPKPCDGEVESFRKVTIDEVVDLACEPGAFMPGSALVLIDFLVRHGIVSAGEDPPVYMELVSLLRSNRSSTITPK